MLTRTRNWPSIDGAPRIMLGLDSLVARRENGGQPFELSNVCPEPTAGSVRKSLSLQWPDRKLKTNAVRS